MILKPKANNLDLHIKEPSSFQVIVNKSRVLARFAFMHCIAASLCFWIFTIVQETVDTIVSKEYFPTKSKCYSDDNTTTYFTDWRDADDGVAGCFFCLILWVKSKIGEINSSSSPLVLCYKVNNTCGETRESEGLDFNVECKLSEMCECADNNDIAKYIFQLGPYLYPFSIEFNILIGNIQVKQEFSTNDYIQIWCPFL